MAHLASLRMQFSTVGPGMCSSRVRRPGRFLQFPQLACHLRDSADSMRPSVTGLLLCHKLASICSSPLVQGWPLCVVATSKYWPTFPTTGEAWHDPSSKGAFSAMPAMDDFGCHIFTSGAGYSSVLVRRCKGFGPWVAEQNGKPEARHLSPSCIQLHGKKLECWHVWPSHPRRATLCCAWTGPNTSHG